MRPLLRSISMCIPTLLAILLATTYARLWTAPAVVPDTAMFLAAAKFHIWGLANRPPFYGLFLRSTLASGNAMAPVYVQVFLWICCVTVFTALVYALTKNRVQAIIGGTLFVLLEWIITYTLAMQWWLIGDPLYTDLLTLGIFTMLIGLVQKKEKVLMIGAIVLGIANLMRPMMTALPIGAAIVLLTMRWDNSKRFLSRCIVIGVILLTTPMLLSTTNYLLGGRFTVSSLTGHVTVSYIRKLWKPGDIVYKDPQQQQDFEETLINGKVPEHLTTYDMYNVRGHFFPSREGDWGALLLFFSSIDPWEHFTQKLFALSHRCHEVMTALIRKHPLTYGKMVLKQTATILMPTQFNRTHNFSVADPMRLYSMIGYSAGSEHGQQAVIGVPVFPEHSDYGFARLFTWNLPLLRLPKSMGKSSLIFMGIIIGVITIESLRRMRSKQKESRMLGVAITICGAHTVLSALGFSLLSLFYDGRYSVPGLMTAQAAIVLTTLSLGTVVANAIKKKWG